MNREAARQMILEILPPSEEADLFTTTGIIFNDFHRFALLRQVDDWSVLYPPSAREALWSLRWFLIAVPPRDVLIDTKEDFARFYDDRGRPREIDDTGGSDNQ